MTLQHFATALWLFLFASKSALSAECKLTFPWEPWPPYFYMEDGNLKGLDHEIAELIAKESGCSFTWKEMVWQRAMMEIKAGRLDAALAASKTKERQEWASFVSAPYRKETMVLFVKKGSKGNYPFTKIPDIVAAKNFLIGVSLGYVYGDEFEKVRPTLMAQGQLISQNADVKSIKELAKDNGKIQGLIGDQYATPYALKNLSLQDKIEAHNLVISEGDVYFMLSKNVSAEHLKKLDDATNALIKSGRVEAILKRYR